MRLLARLLIFLVSSSALICAVVAQEDSLKPTLISVNSDFGLRFHPSNDSSKNVRHLTSLVGHAQIMAGPSYISCQSSIVNSFSGTALPLVWTCSDSGYGDNEDSTIRLFGPGASTRTGASLSKTGSIADLPLSSLQASSHLPGLARRQSTTTFNMEQQQHTDTPDPRHPPHPLKSIFRLAQFSMSTGTPTVRRCWRWPKMICEHHKQLIP